MHLEVTGEIPQLDDEVLPPGKYRIGDTINKTLRLGLKKIRERIIFGEDIEDPKGGVFRLTQKLSTEFPKQVFNSPLAESTIMGVACGLASYGKRPVFELQFIDFIGPAWNQLVTNLSNLRWRSFGSWKCPARHLRALRCVSARRKFVAQPGNEAALAHYPGINVAIPSTPEDAAGLLWTAMHAEDPTFILVPKHLLWAEHESTEPIRAVSLGKARKSQSGSDVTLVAWGNTMEKSLEALEKIGDDVSVELIDLRSIVPWDKEAIEESVRKTGRLVVVQEDTRELQRRSDDHHAHRVAAGTLERNGQSADSGQQRQRHDRLQSDLRIRRACPTSNASLRRFRASVSTKTQRERCSGGRVRPRNAAKARLTTLRSRTASRPKSPAGNAQKIVVPIMGEGIRAAKVVTLLKKPGDKIELDDPLCEVETDKAVYPSRIVVRRHDGRMENQSRRHGRDRPGTRNHPD